MSQKLDHASAEEHVLVKAAQRGDQEAFEELVARHRDRIYTRAYSVVRNENDAIETSQMAWIRIWQRLDQFQGGSSFLTWATRIAINVCLDYLRKCKRLAAESVEKLEEETGGVERHMPALVANPTEGLERQELRDRIDEALAKMSVPHRTALVLHAFEQLEYKEIAKRMRCSVGTVMSRLFYARRRLAALLSAEGLEDYR